MEIYVLRSPGPEHLFENVFSICTLWLFGPKASAKPTGPIVLSNRKTYVSLGHIEYTISYVYNHQLPIFA